MRRFFVIGHSAGTPWKIGNAPRWCPVHYVLFDLLYHRGRCLLRESLARRRQVLAEMCAALQAPAYLVLGVWVVCNNVTTFAYYGYDKFRAVREGRPVPEISLHVFTVVGGSLGAYLGMLAFCHKTIKGVFRIVFWFIVLMQIVASAAAGYGLWQRASA